MLAFSAGAGRPPLVNPAAFNYAAGSIWMTTSRFAAKLQLARNDPRAAFLVDARGESLLLQGLLEVYDLRSLSGQLRAALAGPAFAWSLTGYALKNATFVGGYLMDLARIPPEWWPQNRVVLRLKPQRGRALVLTTEAGARALEGRLPQGSRLKVLAPDRFTLAEAVSALREEGHGRVLSEGGPRVLGELLRQQLLDELFLTLSPVLAGRSAAGRRLGLLEDLAFDATSLLQARLLSARRHGGHLLLRYSLRPTG